MDLSARIGSSFQGGGQTRPGFLKRSYRRFAAYAWKVIKKLIQTPTVFKISGQGLEKNSCPMKSRLSAENGRITDNGSRLGHGSNYSTFAHSCYFLISQEFKSQKSACSPCLWCACRVSGGASLRCSIRTKLLRPCVVKKLSAACHPRARCRRYSDNCRSL